MKKLGKYTCTVALAASLLISDPSQLIYAANTPSKASAADTKQTNRVTAFAGTKLKTFNITSKSYIEISDVLFQYSNNEKIVHYTVTVHNKDNRNLDFMDYWVDVQDTSGSKYSVQANPNNSKSNRVAPQSTQSFKFYAKVNPKLNYYNLKFKLIKWDFSMPNYERVIGEARVTSKYANVVPSNQYYILTKGTERIRTYLQPGSRFNLGDTTQFQATFQLENSGNFVKNVSEYQFYIKTKAGNIVKLNTDIATDQKLESGKKLDVLLSGEVKTNVDLNGSQLFVTQTEGEAKFESPVANYAMTWQAASNIIAEVNKSKTIRIDGVQVETGIEYSYVDEGEKQNDISVTLKFINKGSKAVKLPKYQFELLSSEGVRYPILPEAEDLELVPGIQKELILNGKVPVSVASKSWTLLLQQPKEENKASGYVLSGFKLPTVKTGGSDLSLIRQYQNENSKYEIAVMNTERLPWGDQDIINIYLEVRNNGEKEQLIPDIKSTLKMNGAALDAKDISIIKLDNQILIPTGESIRYVISTKVPYNYKFSKMSLVLNDQLEEKKTRTMGQFTINELAQVKYVRNSYNLDSKGRKATLDLENSYRFEAKNSSMYYVEFSYSNKEDRITELPVLKGYFKTKDGKYIEAEIQNVKSKLSPTGRALLIASAQIPKSYDGEGVAFIVGEAITTGKYSTIEDKPDSYIKAGSFNVPVAVNEVSDKFQDMKINPYLLTFDKVDAGITGNSALTLEIRYTLTDSKKYEVNENKKKLLFEINDGNTTYEQILEIEGEKGLVVGKNQQLKVEFTGPSISRVLSNGYKLNVYEYNNGHKKLLAFKDYSRFYVSQNNNDNS
ncbi:hypothetical protein ACFOQM_11515 [Paenibacillus sp. GCM10012307]|uniref:DUF916 domain-containing protein n=1 Tax=Paenibacillus roseus TaxID=2798579 RepID=A0A934MQI2_9BACL|nr:hypothetical protein [Paenibacillus roseus]MBJ6361913.1 hypothetical protein [Paenibacillus roseus]